MSLSRCDILPRLDYPPRENVLGMNGLVLLLGEVRVPVLDAGPRLPARIETDPPGTLEGGKGPGLDGSDGACPEREAHLLALAKMGPAIVPDQHEGI